MSGTFGRHPLPSENMPEMCAALSTDDLYASAIRIGNFSDSTFDGLIKTRPARAGVKFGIRGEERSIAPAARVHPFPFVIQKFSRKRSFGSFVEDDVLLFIGQWVVWHGVSFLNVSVTM